jgi:hypothetical protein
MQSQKSGHKSKSDVSGWCEKYIQAHLDGKKNLMKIYSAIILKLGGKIPSIK